MIFVCFLCLFIFVSFLFLLFSFLFAVCLLIFPTTKYRWYIGICCVCLYCVCSLLVVISYSSAVTAFNSPQLISPHHITLCTLYITLSSSTWSCLRWLKVGRMNGRRAEREVTNTENTIHIRNYTRKEKQRWRKNANNFCLFKLFFKSIIFSLHHCSQNRLRRRRKIIYFVFLLFVSLNSIHVNFSSFFVILFFLRFVRSFRYSKLSGWLESSLFIRFTYLLVLSMATFTRNCGLFCWIWPKLAVCPVCQQIQSLTHSHKHALNFRYSHCTTLREPSLKTEMSILRLSCCL